MRKCFRPSPITIRSFVLQMSQAAASIDNRVPTPASVAEVNSQQNLPDMTTTDLKSEVKDEDDDSTSGNKYTGIKVEVHP